MKLAWVALLCIVPLLPFPIHSQPCSRADITSAVRNSQAIRAQLLAYKVGYEGMDESVPPALEARIAAYKDALGAIAAGELTCSPAEVEASAVERELARLLDGNKPRVDHPYDPNGNRQEIDQVYGLDLDVKASRPSKAPGLLLIEFRIGIDCGFDAMLLGYEARPSGWVQILRWQSGNYDRIDAAFGDFFNYLVVPEASGQWQIAIAHGHPWCTSNMSAFDVDVIQPVRGHQRQKVTAHEERGYRREEAPSMKAVPGGLQIRTTGSSMDPGIVMRPVIYRFAVNHGQMMRVQPIANNGRDFVDEWLLSPWDEASRWGAADHLDQLKSEHSLFSKQWGKPDGPLQSFGPVRGCTDSQAHFQVELDAEWLDQNGKTLRDEETYFQITEGKNSFTVLSATKTPDARCTGGDIMPPK